MKPSRKAASIVGWSFIASGFGALSAQGGGTAHPQMSFFVTSIGSVDDPNDAYVGGDLGGLAGADALCTSLAAAAGSTGRTWKAYLSAEGVNARDRIGPGPWANALATPIAASVAALHANAFPAALVLDEKSTPVPTSGPDNAHDILTGASQDGGLHPLGSNCGGFQVSQASSYTAVGHADGGGVGQGGVDGGGVAVSWNSAHLSNCSEAGLLATAGHGRLYCFSPEGSSITPGPSATRTPTGPAAATSTRTATATPPPGASATPTPSSPLAGATSTRTRTRTPTAPAGGISVALTVRETSGVARTAEPVRSGVPIPRSSGLLSTGGLRLLGPGGTSIPARFSVLGRWGDGPAAAGAPIRWVLVDFLADVPANGRAVYTLSDAGAGPALANLAISESAGAVTVTTGPARFEVSKASGALLEGVWLDLDGNGQFPDSERMVSGAADLGPFVEASGTEYRGRSTAPMSVAVEDAGPGRATVRVEGFHRDPGGSEELLRFVTRLTFFAGQSYVHVHHTIIEGRIQGSGNGDFDCCQVKTDLERAGLRLRIGLQGAATARVAGDAANAAVYSLSGSDSVSVRQRRTLDWSQPPSFEVLEGTTLVQSGQRAREAWLDLRDAGRGLAVSTRDFWRKDPQQLRASADGTLEVIFPSEPYRIYQAMGLAEELLLDFHPAAATEASLRAHAQGLLKDPLFAVAPPAWYAESAAFGELSPAPSSAFPRYDEALEEYYTATLAWIDEGHARGLLNYLDMPIDQFNGSLDPDQIAWGNSYYDPAAAQIREFARRGELRWLQDLAFPHIRHWYTTDCYDTDDPQHPNNGISGLRGSYHRGAFTGEYHYMESLWDYYYLTGDRRALERGLQAARTYADSPFWENDYDIGLGEPGITTRSIGQKLNTMLEGFLASGDAQLLAAVEADAQDFVTTNGKPEHFFSGSRSATGTYFADQAFMTALIYLPPLSKVHALTGNPAVRDKLVFTPRRLFENYRCLNSPCPGTGVVCGPDVFSFYNLVEVTATGGGNFTAAPGCVFGNSDDHLYDFATMGLVTAMCRSAALSGDPALALQARELFEGRALPAFAGAIWDKPASQYSLRAAEALACIERLAAPTPTASPSPTPGGTPQMTSSPPDPFLAAVVLGLVLLGLRPARTRGER